MNPKFQILKYYKKHTRSVRMLNFRTIQQTSRSLFFYCDFFKMIQERDAEIVEQ